ncbi:hypothetical protein QUC31_014846 [Theobroma cacao]|uniref:Uncharacterized protein isoform 2 n=1 Tax=Theobroma cacao TaxID=3641 RepID=A0A061E9S1_THECC|nr:Uncharacterized protein TCM_007669 isoform 2 [Theobroma cacao]
MSNRKKSSATAESDEVEQLLQAAQDEMLLKLSVDSHMSRVAPDYLDPNLHRRFQALRSRPSTSQSKSQLQKQSPAPLKQQQQQKEEEKKEQKSKVVVVGNVDEELRGVLGDDLSARFAALKASLSSSFSSDPAPAATTKGVSIGLDKSDGEDEEDEVENVIRWAMDAARLDPSPPSDDDDDHIDSDVDDNDDDNDDDYPKNKKKESKSSSTYLNFLFRKLF